MPSRRRLQSAVHRYGYGETEMIMPTTQRLSGSLYYGRLFHNMALCLVCLAACLQVLQLEADESFQITGVSADRTVYQLGDQPIAIRFHINQPATVQLHLYDARDYRIRTVASPDILSAGDHQLTWQGRSDQGDPVPPEAYVYTLTAHPAKGGEPVIYDVTDLSGGTSVVIDDITYDPATQTVRYSVPKPARVFLRAGKRTGQLVDTLINNAPKTAGTHSLTWDGRDASGAVSFVHHPDLRFYGRGFEVSRNTLIVQGEVTDSQTARWLPLSAEPIQRSAQSKRRGLDRHAYHAVTACTDVPVQVSLPADLPTNADGLPLVSGPVPIRVSLAPSDALQLAAERAEITYYLDGQLLYENEISYFPYTWRWDPKVLSGGVHTLTAFVAGFGEHFGVATIRFELAGSGFAGSEH